MSALRAELTVTLRATGPGEGAGTLTGHPATPTVRTRRAGDRLHLHFTEGARTIGDGVLALDLLGAPPLWAGEVELDTCRWWVRSVLGSGILDFSQPRGPRRRQP